MGLIKRKKKEYKKRDFNALSKSLEGKGWMKIGLIWGISMYVLMTFLFPIINGEGDSITWKRSLIGIVVWVVGGLVFGYLLKIITSKNGKTEKFENE